MDFQKFKNSKMKRSPKITKVKSIYEFHEKHKIQKLHKKNKNHEIPKSHKDTKEDKQSRTITKDHTTNKKTKLAKFTKSKNTKFRNIALVHKIQKLSTSHQKSEIKFTKKHKQVRTRNNNSQNSASIRDFCVVNWFYMVLSMF